MRMKTVIVFMCVFALVGCSKTHHPANAQTKKDLTQAQTIVKGCINKGNLITKKGRTAILTCLAPPGHSAALERCIQGKVAHDKFFTKRQRAAFEQDVAVCVEMNR